MWIFVLTATYELRVSRKSHLRDHPNWTIMGGAMIIPRSLKIISKSCMTL
jgi:hypothetical protein